MAKKVSSGHFEGVDKIVLLVEEQQTIDDMMAQGWVIIDRATDPESAQVKLSFEREID